MTTILSGPSSLVTLVRAANVAPRGMKQTDTDPPKQTYVVSLMWIRKNLCGFKIFVDPHKFFQLMWFRKNLGGFKQLMWIQTYVDPHK